MEKRIFDTEGQACSYMAQSVHALLQKKPDALVCFAAGHTTLPLFDALEKLGTSFSQARFVAMDEWLGVPPEMPGSCNGFLRENFLDRFSLQPENILLFNAVTDDPAAECKRVEAGIEAMGGLDYILLGMGMNGHLALIEPGDSLTLGAHEVPLSQTTLEVAHKYFPGDMPPITRGLTLGIPNMLAARRVQCAVFGAHKAEVVQRFLSLEPTADFPATVLKNAPHAELVMDRAAAGQR